MRIALLLALILLPGISPAQSTAQPDLGPVSTRPDPSLSAPPPRAPAPSSATVNALQSSVDHLTQNNRDLLDLLKKQQSVLEDIQFDRRLQSRQIESLEARLQETLFENAKLQGKVDSLTAAVAAAQRAPAPAPAAPTNDTTTTPPPTAAAKPAPPATPASYLPTADPEGPPGAPSWHRVLTLSGTDSRSTDPFQIQGHRWRILWHNQDKDGTAYKNTSALFLNAFPKDDIIPQKVCAKLGSGGGSTDLVGPGNYYVKVEASGGTWEFAVEDFH
jgi:hypothetical protein